MKTIWKRLMIMTTSCMIFYTIAGFNWKTIVGGLVLTMGSIWQTELHYKDLLSEVEKRIDKIQERFKP